MKYVSQGHTREKKGKGKKGGVVRETPKGYTPKIHCHNTHPKITITHPKKNYHKDGTSLMECLVSCLLEL
jgi:hypothetical protein